MGMGVRKERTPSDHVRESVTSCLKFPNESCAREEAIILSSDLGDKQFLSSVQGRMACKGTYVCGSCLELRARA